MFELTWGPTKTPLTFSDASGVVALTGVAIDSELVEFVHTVPLVDVLTVGSGHVPASARTAHTAIGAELRYRRHEVTADSLTIVSSSEDRGIETLSTITVTGPASWSSSTTVRNVGDRDHVVLSVTSWSAAVGAELDGMQGAPSDWMLVSGRNDWLAEGRWVVEPVHPSRFPDLAAELTGHNPRGSLSRTSQGTWSTGQHLPTAALASVDRGLAWAWQVEHNGAWRWEVGQDNAGLYVSLGGPTDRDSSWSRRLAPGEEFTTVPVGVAVAPTWQQAIGEITAHRRATRRQHPDNTAMPVVFNDYMNTLDGDPTTEKLLPLIAAAASVGAEVFCIDAGWYDDTGYWWDSVGAWLPSTSRFPGGLDEVLDAIRAEGMTPGLWLEPEVIGVRSSVAGELPDAAFLQRHGERIVEHDRYHLDLRHPAARAHLDAAVDRLVADAGVGFFKFDYNIDPGAGTDLDVDSVGDGLLQHNRAVLAWLDGVLDRHPGLVIENCSSGAMRSDWAVLSRLAMQSTSDQQDWRKYPPIAAAAPMMMLPEQAASWAYPQPEMTLEEAGYCLVTGLLGRYYVSGYLNRMDEERLRVVREAIAVAKDLRQEIPATVPAWPLGLPAWNDAWVAAALVGPTSTLLSIWRRGAESDSVCIPLPQFTGRPLEVETVFPVSLERWPSEWDAEAGVLTLRSGSAPFTARTVRLVPSHPDGGTAPRSH